jgi:hypothetical protein
MCLLLRRQTVYLSIMLAVLVGMTNLARAENAAGGSRSVQIKIKGEDGAPKEVRLYKGSYALLIGVSNYTAGWPRLPGVLQDLEDVEKSLKSHGFEVLILKDPDSVRLVSGIKDFINRYGLEPENRILIYFAGHGHTEKLAYGDEMGYIVPSDAPNPNVDKKGFKAKALDMQQFESFARTIESKHALFVFDSCFSGSLFAITRAIPESISYKTSRPVRQFMTSGSADESVPDKSVFKSQFIEGIGGEADSDRDGFVTGTELGNFLESRVVNYSNGCQHPQYGKIREQNLDKGDFVFQPAGKTDEGQKTSTEEGTGLSAAPVAVAASVPPLPAVTSEPKYAASASATPFPVPSAATELARPVPEGGAGPRDVGPGQADSGSMKKRIRPVMGVSVKKMTPELARQIKVPVNYGLLIMEVHPRSLAEKAGLLPGDILVNIDRQKTSDLEDLKRILMGYKRGDPMTLAVCRNRRIKLIRLER